MEDLLEKALQLSVLKTNQKLPDYKRFLYKKIKNNSSKIVGIYGARGVGKTTLMLQVIKSLNLPAKESLYISCDHPIFTDLNLFEFLDFFSKKGGKVIFIDEIHKVKNFQKHLKSAYDFLNLKIYFSGSSAVQITNPDFIRRYSMYKLPILSLREFIELFYKVKLTPITLEDILNNHQVLSEEIIRTLRDKRILALFDEYNTYGAYPFSIEDKNKFLDKLQAVIDATLYFDLADIYKINIDKIHTLKKLLITVCVSKPLELSIEKLANISNISKATLYKYLDYLSKADLILHITHEAKRFKSVRKPDKLYLANTNLFKALCLEPDKGNIRETFFASMLSFGHKIYYVDRGDFLVDERFIFEIGGKNKDFSQIKSIENAYLATDNIEISLGNKIPLWLFGFLY
ncbi:ATP-binding protein [Persephonella sp.]